MAPVTRRSSKASQRPNCDSGSGGRTCTGDIRLKVESIRGRSRLSILQKRSVTRVENRGFEGGAELSTFSREELLATKLRALLQRNKGRDLLVFSRRSKHSRFWTTDA